MPTKISWTDETWNPVTGCTKVSEGCKHCYAERLFPRVYPGRKFSDVRCHPDRLEQPLRWRKPRRVFVNSMSDLFHEHVSNEFIYRVFATMALCPQHQFQVLTKRPERMAELMGARYMPGRLWDTYLLAGGLYMLTPWPFPNVWLGVSVENQETAGERIPLLLKTPAAVRFLSCEPLLGPINVGLAIRKIHWIIAGAESGPRARPMDERWVRGLQYQCEVAQVPFFYKQRLDENGHKIELPELDGRVWDQMPGAVAA